MSLRPRPAIKPWLPRMWRHPRTLQIGVEPGNGVVLSGVDLSTATWLAGLDGSRSEGEVLADAAVQGLDLGSAVRILSGLSLAGVLLGAPVSPDGLAEAGPFAPELVALTETSSTASNGGQVLDARSRRYVQIEGANRIGVPLGALLSASGVGILTFLDTASVRLCDATVGGLDLDDEGEARILAAQRAVRRTSHVELAGPAAAPEKPDLVILCQPWTAHDPLHGHPLVERGAHLAVAVREGRVVIGPLVVPGRTSCLRCAEVHRTDRDPRWPAVAAQLAAGQSRAMHEPTSVLAALAAALAAAQVLDFLDGNRAPDVIEATLEVRPPDWQMCRRAWPPHVDCGCLETGADPLSATG